MFSDLENELKHRFIHFDLDTNQLKKYYTVPAKWRNAYKDMGKFLKDNNFEIHRQYSGYLSKEPLSRVEVMIISEKMYKAFPWLEQCVRRLDMSSKDEYFDLNEMHKQVKQGITKDTPLTKSEETEYDKNIQPALPGQGKKYDIYKANEKYFYVTLGETKKRFSFDDKYKAIYDLYKQFGMSVEKAEEVFNKAQKQDALKNSILNAKKQREQIDKERALSPAPQKDKKTDKRNKR